MKAWKLVTVILVVILMGGSVGWIFQSGIKGGVVAYGEYTCLGLAVSPSGSSFSVGVNESFVLSAEAMNGTAPFTFSWTVCVSGNFTLSINGQEMLVSNDVPLTFSGQELTLMYPEATMEFVSVSVSVKDAAGLSGSLWRPIVVADPYSSPGYKFDATTASFNYIVEADGLGWFRTVNGTDGSVSWSSVTSATVLQNALDTVSTSPATGGSIVVLPGIYSAAVTVKNATRLVLEFGAIGITTSIAALATCIIENYQSGLSSWYNGGSLVFQNNAFNGISLGTYASFSQLYTDSLTAVSSVALSGGGVFPGAPSFTIYAVGSTYYAKAANGTICWSSTNAATVFSAVSAVSTSGQSWYIKNGIYYLNGSIVVSGSSARLNIIGESETGTTLSLLPGADCDVIKVAVACSISNLNIDGNKAHNSIGNGINVSYTPVTLQNMQIINCADNAVLIDNADQEAFIDNIVTSGNGKNAFYVSYCSGTRITNIHSVLDGGGVYFYQSDVCTLKDSTFDRSGVIAGDQNGELYINYSSHIITSGNMFDAGSGIQYQSSNLANITLGSRENEISSSCFLFGVSNPVNFAAISIEYQANAIYNNYISGAAPSGGVGILLTGGNIGWNNIYANRIAVTGGGTGISGGGYMDRIHENDLVQSTIPASGFGWYMPIYANLGYVTENTINNVANTTATTFVFNHGLASTANSVQCSFDMAVGYTWTWTSSTTQITITVTPNSGVSLPATMHILSADVKYHP